MGLLYAAIGEVRDALGMRMAFGNTDLGSVSEDIFGVISVKNVKMREKIEGQDGSLLPLDITLSTDIYAKNNLPYEDVLDYVDNNLLTPLVENNFNVSALTTAPLTFDNGLKRNIMKCDVTLHWTYKE